MYVDALISLTILNDTVSPPSVPLLPLGGKLLHDLKGFLHIRCRRKTAQDSGNPTVGRDDKGGALGKAMVNGFAANVLFPRSYLFHGQFV